MGTQGSPESTTHAGTGRSHLGCAQIIAETHSAHTQLPLDWLSLGECQGYTEVFQNRQCFRWGPSTKQASLGPCPQTLPWSGTHQPSRVGCPLGEAISPASSATHNSGHLPPLPMPHRRGGRPGP